MRYIGYFNFIVSIVGVALGIIAWLKTVTARHSFNLYVVSGVVLIGGALIRYFTTGDLLKSGAELITGIFFLAYIFSTRGSVRIR